MRISYRLLPLLFLSFCFACSTTVKKTDLKGNFELSLDYTKFVNPPAEYRSFPFYSLNDKLDTAEIKLQIEGFKNAGFGGFYLHSRDGLITEFLGDEWWQNMQAAVDAANANGLHVMFYDEDKWPSGYAGGIIPKMNEAYRAKCLARLLKDTPLPEGSVLLKADEKYNYIEYTTQLGNQIFNGTSYVDLMNPETVKAFLDVSYKPYVEKYKSQITNYTTGIFSDEPHIHARYFDRKTPNEGLYSYSPSVRTKFKKLFGYDFMDKVELLFEEKENWHEVRLQYHQAVALQFEESFTKQIATYCETNGIKYTGHYLAEDVLEKVRDRAGNTMLHYRNMQQPGMDNLGLGFDGKLITARALSSVANQYEIPRRLTEIFGISGQNMNFEDRKWIAGWHTINGVNHFCPHLTLYSMKGLRKRDYPPTFSYHQPYFKDNKILEDYLGRISYAATIGHYKPQILVINPLESEFAKGDNDGSFTHQTLDLLEKLQELHYDYDLGDEQIMSEIAKIEKNRLTIGAMNYEVVILPDMIELRTSTTNLLNRFAKEGGKIIYVDRFPEYFDGKTNSTLQTETKNNCTSISINELTYKLPQIVKPNLTMEGDSGKVWSHVRSIADGSVLIQLYNTSRTQTQYFNLQTDLLANNPVLWDPSSTKCFSIQTQEDKSFALEIAPSSTIWITSGTLSKDAQNMQPFALNTTATSDLKWEKWKIERKSPNAITLDFAQYSIDGGKTFSDPEPVIGIFNRLANQNYNGELQLQYKVEIEVIPATCRLCVEDPTMFNYIECNSKSVQFESKQWFIDHSFPTADVVGSLQKGSNTISMKLDFNAPIKDSQSAPLRYGTEIESIYLLGDFAVQAHYQTTTWDSQRNNNNHFQNRPVYGFSTFSLSKEPEFVTGNLALEGYPFFAGSMTLYNKINFKQINKDSRYFIEFPNCEAITIQVEMDGNDCGTLVWAPFKLDITPYLHEGNSTLKITLTNSLRNLLGPHHQQQAELIKVGPYSFGGTGGFPDAKGDANWYDLRKVNAPMRIWTDTYFVIPFGFIEPPVITQEKNQN